MRGSAFRVGQAVVAAAVLLVTSVACGDDAGDLSGAASATTEVPSTSAAPATSPDADDRADDGDVRDSDDSSSVDDHDHDHDHDDHDEQTEGAGASHDDRAEHDAAQVRLFVADGDAARATIIDFETREVVGSVDLDDVAELGTATSEDGRYVYVAHAESVSLVDGAVWTVSHGSHAHYYSAEPIVVGRVEGSRPTHLVSHDGIAAMWFDGTGTAALLDETELASGAVEVFAIIETEMPHHGFAVPFHGHYITTSQHEETDSGMPGVVGVRTLEGELVAAFDCADTHGEGALAHTGLAACADGVLIVTEAPDDWAGELVPYPQVDDVDPFGYGEPRAWGLAINADAGRVGAPFGVRHVLWLDPASGHADAFEVADHDSGAVVAQFGVAIHNGGDVVAVLTSDGYVRTVDTHDGTILDEVQAMEPFVEDFETELWPQLLIVGDSVLAVDPHGARIIELDIRDLAVVDVIELDFTPSIVQVLGT